MLFNGYGGVLYGADVAASDSIGVGTVTWQDAGEIVVEFSVLHEDTVVLREHSRSSPAGGGGGGRVPAASIAHLGSHFLVVWMESRSVRAATLACELDFT